METNNFVRVTNPARGTCGQCGYVVAVMDNQVIVEISEDSERYLYEADELEIIP